MSLLTYHFIVSISTHHSLYVSLIMYPHVIRDNMLSTCYCWQFTHVDFNHSQNIAINVTLLVTFDTPLSTCHSQGTLKMSLSMYNFQHISLDMLLSAYNSQHVISKATLDMSLWTCHSWHITLDISLLTCHSWYVTHDRSLSTFHSHCFPLDVSDSSCHSQHFTFYM